MDIIQAIISALGVNETQAKGALGLLLKLLKDKLGGDQYKQVSEQIPDSESLVKNAPQVGKSLWETILGLFGAASGAVKGLGQLASLIKGFEKLGIKAEHIQPFLAAVIGFLKQKGGPEVSKLVEGLMK